MRHCPDCDIETTLGECPRCGKNLLRAAEQPGLCIVQNLIHPRHKWGRDWRRERCGVAMPMPKPERKEERTP